VDANRFVFSLSVPRDAKYVPTVCRLAVQAARYASCADADAETFGGSVEDLLRSCLREPSDGAISVVVRRDAGPVEVRVNGHAVTVEP
jgi:hypothetical protein